MANNYYDVRVDISKEKVIDSGFTFTKGDSTVIYLRVAVMNGADKFDATGTTPTIVFKKADGGIVVGTPTLSNDVWVYQIQGTELNCIGKVLCDIKFAYASGRISSGKFTIMVEADTLDGASQGAKYYFDEYGQLVEASKGYAQTAEAKAKESKSYAIGGTGTRTGEDTDNSKYYYEQAKSIANVSWSTVTDKPFTSIGQNLSVDSDGKLNAQASGGASSWNDLTGKPFSAIGDNLSVDEDGNLNAEASGSWGSITGTLTDQTDLKNALDGKASASDVSSLSSTIVNKADKSTTLAGYGITDGATKSQVTSLSNEIATLKGYHNQSYNSSSTLANAIEEWTLLYAPTNGATEKTGAIVCAEGTVYIAAYIDMNKNSIGFVTKWGEAKAWSFYVSGGASTVLKEL